MLLILKSNCVKKWTDGRRGGVTSYFGKQRVANIANDQALKYGLSSMEELYLLGVSLQFWPVNI